MPPDGRKRRLTSFLGRALTVAFAARAVYLFVPYLAGSRSVMRYQVESAVTAFLVVGIVSLVANGSSEFNPDGAFRERPVVVAEQHGGAVARAEVSGDDDPRQRRGRSPAAGRR